MSLRLLSLLLLCHVSAAAIESCPELMGDSSFVAPDSALAGEWDLAHRVQKLLGQAPTDFFAAIGATFLTVVAPVEDAELIREFRNHYGDNWKALIHRRVILEASRVLISDSTWDQVWPVFSDDGLFEFLVHALLRLEVREVRIDKPMLATKLKRELYAYLDHNFPLIPRYETLLAASPVFQESFSELMQNTFIRFPVNLSSPSMQKNVAEWLRQGRLGFEREFVRDWIALSLRKMSETYPSDLSGMESLPQELWNTPFNMHLSLLDPSLRIFFYRIVMEPQLNTRFYTGHQVREAFGAQLEEHQQLVRELVGSSTQNDVLPDVLIEPSKSESSTLNEFEALITGQLPLESLCANHDYPVTFTRQIGHRHRTQRIRFTERAAAAVRNSKAITGLPASSWLSAILLGPASARGMDGIKLLRVSPFRRSGLMDLEVKRLNTPWRLFGHRDQTGRFVFDNFHQGK